jgi:signal transduction histidine kinase
MNINLNTDEAGRLEALQSFKILDSIEEEEFDNLTLLASQIAGTKLAQINLIDENRQWSKSMVGMSKENREMSRDDSVCQFTITKPGMTEIPDLTKDERTSGIDYVKDVNGFRYYLGIPLITDTNYAIGSLCVLDFETKTLSDTQIGQLKIIAKEVMTHLELHKKNRELQQLNEYKIRLMKILSHDMRSPLNGIIGLSGMLREQLGEEKSEHYELIDIIEQSSTQLNQMIDEMMNYSVIESGGLTSNPKKVNLKEIIENITRLYRPASRIKNIDLKISKEKLEEPVWIDGEKLEQVLGNLLSNAIKYTKAGGTINLSLMRKQEFLEVRVTDSGIGMSGDEIENLFRNEKKQHISEGTNGEKSTGIGLTIVQHIIRLFEGDIHIDSTPGKGTTFMLKIPV